MGVGAEATEALAEDEARGWVRAGAGAEVGVEVGGARAGAGVLVVEEEAAAEEGMVAICLWIAAEAATKAVAAEAPWMTREGALVGFLLSAGEFPEAASSLPLLRV